MSAEVCRNYGIHNPDTCDYAEEGDSLDRITYWDNEKQETINNVTIANIDEYDVEIVTEDFDIITIPVDDIEDWD